ncbi:MAG: energy-coupling factor transporter transmembrane protein EcfT [Spirochaetaceae bacterium]|nr:energy-coupling factor transporter transmembrane protein EcfT [Spirochaetaceae bacterium]
MSRIITYKEKNCFIHRLCGLTKLIFFLMWTLVTMLTYDTRVLAVMVFASIVIFGLSKTEWKQVRSVFLFIMFFLLLNVTAIFLFSPYEGCKIYGSRTDLMHIAGNYTFTAEQLFYELNVILKYFTIVPSVFMFITSTNPSEFAASLNRIGLPYTICYSVAIALRYIPDVQSDFNRIKNAQEARGIEMSGKANIFSRLKNMSAILFPLIFTSMERIDSISSAMELRGFGKNKKRTWYSGRKLSKADILIIAGITAVSAAALFITYRDGSRFYNPFN